MQSEVGALAGGRFLSVLDMDPAALVACLRLAGDMKEVIDSSASVVFDQAENRLHAQKALLAMLS